MKKIESRAVIDPFLFTWKINVIVFAFIINFLHSYLAFPSIPNNVRDRRGEILLINYRLIQTSIVVLMNMQIMISLHFHIICILHRKENVWVLLKEKMVFFFSLILFFISNIMYKIGFFFMNHVCIIIYSRNFVFFSMSLITFEKILINLKRWNFDIDTFLFSFNIYDSHFIYMDYVYIHIYIFTLNGKNCNNRTSRM